MREIFFGDKGLTSTSANHIANIAKDIGVDIPQGESLPLCDIYNYMSKNDYTDKNNKKTIGF